MPRPKSDKDLKAQWAKSLQHLVGKKIVGIYYMSNEEQKAAGFYRAPVMFELEGGTVMWPMADDEGNDAGAMAIAYETEKERAKFVNGAPTI